MITIFSRRLLVLSFIVCLISANVYAMHDDKDLHKKIQQTTTKKTTPNEFTKYTRAYFEGWKPTLTFLGCATAYCLRYDRQAPLKAMVWLRDSFVETPKLVAYPAAFLGMCCAYSYYKPRFEALYQRIKDRNFSL